MKIIKNKNYLWSARYIIHVTDKFKIKIGKEIDKYYHETGMFLINKQKIKNEDIIEFIKDDSIF